MAKYKVRYVWHGHCICQTNCNVYVLIGVIPVIGDDSGKVLGLIDPSDLTELNDLN